MRNQAVSDKAKAFLAKNPTLIGRVNGTDFYEHPTLGDESPLIMVMPSGELRRSEHWELPSADEYREGY